MLAFNGFDPISIVIVLVGLSLAPFIILMVSSFVKITIIFNLIRNALGVQQVPPNLVLNGLAVIMTIYVMAPIAQKTMQLVMQEKWEGQDYSQIENSLDRIKKPIQEFLYKHSQERQRLFFISTAKRLWPKEFAANVKPNDLLILIPAFTVSELTSAFEIGFLLYLPFIAIDLVVSNILLAMGMMMVSPMTISVPFKLMLFVLINGWSKLIEGLVLTYQ